jgi:hypothetical protein
MSKKQKDIKQRDFNRKIQIWTIVVPLITCLFSSMVAVGVATISLNSKSENVIPVKDQVELNGLATQIKLLSGRFFQTSDPVEKERLNAELRVLANAETSIMKKYNPDFESRWPILTASSTPTFTPSPASFPTPRSTPFPSPTPATTFTPYPTPFSAPAPSIKVLQLNTPWWTYLVLCSVLGVFVFFLIRRIGKSILAKRYNVVFDANHKV